MDNAFTGRAFPGHTTAELRAFIASGAACAKVQAEVLRRDAVAAGDVSKMTSSERLRFARTGKA